ncbi:MAG: secondary thiamine-phosphate synthase enzyme YjbQ [Pseudomonadota bacterium]
MGAKVGTLEIPTNGPGFYMFTPRLAEWLRSTGVGDGLLTLLIQHTSCSLLIQENADPDVRLDLTEFLDRLAPPTNHPAMAWMRHTIEGPDDMPAHVKASLLPVNLQVPVADGRMRLGTWQGVYLVEHRRAAHNRSVALHFA